MAIKLNNSLHLTVGFLLEVEEAQVIDEDTLNRLKAHERLDPQTKRTVLQVLDTFLRDATVWNEYTG